MSKGYWMTLPAVFVLVLLLGCAPKPVEPPSGASGMACIRGAVFFTNPVDTKEGPYPGVTVSAWVHGKDKGLAETRTDSAGNFCVEVPFGAYEVDLRVWGLERFEHQNYICEGTVEGVALKAGPGKCGSGNCVQVDIKARCRVRIERR